MAAEPNETMVQIGKRKEELDQLNKESLVRLLYSKPFYKDTRPGFLSSAARVELIDHILAAEFGNASVDVFFDNWYKDDGVHHGL